MLIQTCVRAERHTAEILSDLAGAKGLQYRMTLQPEEDYKVSVTAESESQCEWAAMEGWARIVVVLVQTELVTDMNME